ncbi:MAG: hypothetical protein ACRELY_16815, partial [Polyangiaceae bacterium]
EQAAPKESASVELRLAIGPAGIGLELGKEARIGPLRVTSLGVRLPSAKFPIDVSGGVSRFRHKRGELGELVVEVDVERLRKWAARELRGVVSPGTCAAWISVARHGGTLAVSDEEGRAVLAFDFAVESRDGAITIFPMRARGASLPAPPTALAIASLEALLGDISKRDGAAFVLPTAIESLSRAVLPEAGARAPSCEGVKWTSLAAARDAWILHASAVGAPFEPHPFAARAHETASLVREADESLHARAFDEARHAFLTLLERAPRHPEIVARIAEIDVHVGSRAEAALGLLAEAERDPELASPLRWLRAALLAETGDVTGAIAAYASASEREEAPMLAARGFEIAADLTHDPIEALAWLDRAVTRAPTVRRLLLRRLEARLAAGRIPEALADAERLEAQARGSKERYRAWMDVARAHKTAGFSAHAATFFERALRFVPDDIDALSGLGHALVNEGRVSRGVALLARSLDLADARLRKGAPLPASYYGTVVAIARAFAEALDDRPAAVARVRTVPNDAPEAPMSRALEGRWRAELGDRAGASLAFARLRELAEEAPDGSPEFAPLLIEAATFEDSVRGDFLAAHRMLATGRRVAPQHVEVDVFYKQITAKIPANRAARAEPANARAEVDLVTLEARADELARKLQADATNDAVADELATCLEKLGRDMDLFALVSARLEDAVTPAERAKWLPRQRDVLRNLEASARAAGDERQALFYADALARLESS